MSGALSLPSAHWGTAASPAPGRQRPARPGPSPRCASGSAAPRPGQGGPARPRPRPGLMERQQRGPTVPPAAAAAGTEPRTDRATDRQTEPRTERRSGRSAALGSAGSWGPARGRRREVTASPKRGESHHKFPNLFSQRQQMPKPQPHAPHTRCEDKVGKGTRAQGCAQGHVWDGGAAGPRSHSPDIPVWMRYPGQSMAAATARE